MHVRQDTRGERRQREGNSEVYLQAEVYLEAEGAPLRVHL